MFNFKERFLHCRSIADQLQSQGSVEPETFDLVTILFTDIKGFTALSSSSTPIEVGWNELVMCSNNHSVKASAQQINLKQWSGHSVS